VSHDFWRKKRVLVTGAGGFVASWLAKGLVEAGAQVVALVLDWVPRSTLTLIGVADQVTRVQGSVTDAGLMQRVLHTYEIDTVFHLAGQALVGVANRSPVATFEANIQGTWTVLEACRHCPSVERVVVASSDKAYGVHARLPYTEDFPLQGLYPYDASKACADLLSRCYAATYGLPVAVTRCANIYGGGDLHPSRLIPEVIQAVLQGRPPVIRSDGSPTRDYLYIDDAVRAYLTLAEQLDRPEIRGQAFNFGTHSPISVLELVHQIIALAGVDLEPEVRGTATGEIDHQYLDSTKAARLLGWYPQICLQEGLRRTLAWYRERPELWA
jgi:CDP-glucose 4,6-dehydratase